MANAAEFGLSLRGGNVDVGFVFDKDEVVLGGSCVKGKDLGVVGLRAPRVVADIPTKSGNGVNGDLVALFDVVAFKESKTNDLDTGLCAEIAPSP